MAERVKELIIIMIIISSLCAGAYVIAGWIGEDIEAKNIAVCPSAKTVCGNEFGDFTISWTGIEDVKEEISEPNEPIEMREAEIMGETNLISLEDWNNQQIEMYQKINQPTKNGIACPECGKEMFDSNNIGVLLSNPTQYHIHCECGFESTRF